MLMEQRLKEAFDKKKQENVNNYVWKYEKVKEGNNFIQKTVKLVDCSIEELKKFYDYCNLMLNNGSKNNPGRYVFMEIVDEQIAKCNTELFLRWLQKENKINKFSFMNVITTFLNNNPSLDRDELTLDNVIGKCPYEFKDLSLDMVLDGCMDTLGLFSKKHITKSFILRQGVWPSEKEREFLNKNKIKLNSKYIIEYLGLNPDLKVRINAKGLSLEQMKSMIMLLDKKYKKFSEMSTAQLELLRNRILYALKSEIRFHINSWEHRKHQIEEVLNLKGVKIN